MSNKMKAAVLYKFGEPLKIEEVDIPTPASGQIVVKMQASGVAIQISMRLEGDWPAKPNPPLDPWT